MRDSFIRECFGNFDDDSEYCLNVEHCLSVVECKELSERNEVTRREIRELLDEVTDRLRPLDVSVFPLSRGEIRLVYHGENRSWSWEVDP